MLAYSVFHSITDFAICAIPIESVQPGDNKVAHFGRGHSAMLAYKLDALSEPRRAYKAP